MSLANAIVWSSVGVTEPLTMLVRYIWRDGGGALFCFLLDISIFPSAGPAASHVKQITAGESAGGFRYLQQAIEPGGQAERQEQFVDDSLVVDGSLVPDDDLAPRDDGLAVHDNLAADNRFGCR